MIQPVKAICQIAYIVDDLDEALKYWIDIMRVGPFFLIDSSSIEDARYHGQPTGVELTAALSYSGTMCVEIIQQTDDSESVYRDVLDRRGPGFHHWGVMTENFDRDISDFEARGYPLVFSGRVKVGGRFAYMDCLEDSAGMVELIELSPVVKELFEGMQSAALDWDGKDPVRRA